MIALRKEKKSTTKKLYKKSAKTTKLLTQAAKSYPKMNKDLQNPPREAIKSQLPAKPHLTQSPKTIFLQLVSKSGSETATA